MPVLNDKNIQNYIKTGIAVIKFYSLWDSSSRALEEPFKQLSDEFRGKAKFIESDINSNPAVAEELRITKVPSVVVFVHGRLVAKIDSSASKRILKEKIDYFVRQAESLR